MIERWIDCEACGVFGFIEIELHEPDADGAGWGDYTCPNCGHLNYVEYDTETLPGRSTRDFTRRQAVA